MLQAPSWYTMKAVAQQTCVISESANMASNPIARRLASGQPPCGKACKRYLLQLATSEVLEDQGVLLFLCFFASPMSFIALWLLQQT